MKRFAWLWVCVAAAGCGGKTPPGPSGTGSGSAVIPPICLHSQPIEIRDPASVARALRFSGTWLLMLGPNCAFDRQALRQAVLGCTANNTCGTPFDAAGLGALNQQLAQAQASRLQLGGRPIDVMRIAGGTAFGFGSPEDLIAGLGGGIGPVPQGPGPGPRPPGPTGGGGGSSAAGPEIPCCPGCGRCIPNDCPDPPPVDPRFHADGCDTRVCSESLPPGIVCECFEAHCRPG